MRRLTLLAVVAALACSLATTADAQKLDKNGRCHAANGQFAKAEVCGGVSKKGAVASRSMAPSAAPAPVEARPAAAAPPSRTSAAQRCKDAKGRFTKCGAPGAHPVG